MNKVKTLTLLVMFLIICGNALLSAQEVSEKRDIAIFKLSYYDWTMPNEALGSVDAQIRAVFVNMGRFNVLAMTYRLGTNDVNDFIDKIKAYKEENVEIPEAVNMGHEVFSLADLNQLISSFIVIIPSVTFYDFRTIRNAEGEFQNYEATLRTSFSILNVDTMLLEKEILIETTGTDKEKPDLAVQDAVDAIQEQLVFELKSVPIFTLKTGILEVYQNGITMEMGKDMGILPGFEFVILEEQVLKSGKKRVFETGLVIVNKADEEVSEATVIYGKPKEGDQLKEVPRVGFEGTLYVHPLGEITADGFDISMLAVGLRTTLALGVYSFRPFAGVEVPFNLSSDSALLSYLIWSFGVPMTAYLGAEYTMYLGRIQISPAALIGVSGIYLTDASLPDDERFALTHLGLSAYLQASYLISREIKVAIDLGYTAWLSVYGAFDSYNKVLLGAGVIYKF